VTREKKSKAALGGKNCAGEIRVTFGSGHLVRRGRVFLAGGHRVDSRRNS